MVYLKTLEKQWSSKDNLWIWLTRVIFALHIHYSPLGRRELCTFFFDASTSVSLSQCVVGGTHSFPGAQTTISPSCSDWFRDGNRSRWANESIPAFFYWYQEKDVLSTAVTNLLGYKPEAARGCLHLLEKSAQGKRPHRANQSETTVSEPESSHPRTRLFHSETQYISFFR